MHVEIYRIPTSAPDDVSELSRLIDQGIIDPTEIVAVIGKTEGNGELDDFSRGYANATLQTLLAQMMGTTRESVAKRIPMIQSGGCEGVMTPHMNVFVRRESTEEPDGQKRLAIGVGFTRDLLPEEIGTMAQVREVARAVGEVVQAARISDPKDVHFVQMKTPLITPADIAEATERGNHIPHHIAKESMAYSNAAAALGVAMALGEIAEDEIHDDMILQRLDLYSSVAAPSSGNELRNCHIVVLGNSPHATSDSVIGHAVMSDPLDAAAVREAMRQAGISFDCLPTPSDLERIQLAIAKSGIHPGGLVRNRRTTLLTDVGLQGRTIRAVFNAVIASVTGDPLVCVSGAPTVGTHSGPPGGGIVAIVAGIRA